ncbi:STAS domain-containing protein [Streptomyces aureocirculatus]|uniref:STAS domain-containing protein n=1 Tax=Streptomyces aureocirculatus TaxID=67275 RepID=UPI0007C43932|nr:STAS domain-containing protein [Streptomyces aureocirculatus]
MQWTQGDAAAQCSVEVHVDERRGVCVVAVVGEMDVEYEPDIELALETRPVNLRLVLDVTRLEFADSTMLNILIRTCRRHDMRLLGPIPKQLYELLRVSGTLGHFQVCGSLEEACAP